VKHIDIKDSNGPLYRVSVEKHNQHLYQVRLTIHSPQALQLVSLPVWIPGSYLVREFARHLQNFRAFQGRQARAVRQKDKCSWEIVTNGNRPLVLEYEVYAFDASVRSAWLDSERGFFNGTSLFLRVHGQETLPHRLDLKPPAKAPAWQVATGLSPVKVNARGFGIYRAADYDELVDCPVEIGSFWSGKFNVGGIAYRFVVTGALPSFDGNRLLQDVEKICRAAIQLWHGTTTQAARKAQHANYLFLLNAVDDAYGGLEHRNSTALIARRTDLPRQGDPGMGDGYLTLLGLISHEYFHTWNVKRLRPAEFERYDYAQENYTSLLWFFEGFTSYYDDLLLLRAGLIDQATYLKLLNRTIEAVAHTPGRKLQSVAQASFDAWVKYYRADENTPNSTVSYYAKGSLIGVCLDLSLRQAGHSLDDLMRGLWKRCNAGPMREQDILDELLAITGRSWKKEIDDWVHGTNELPLAKLLQSQGVVIDFSPATFAQRMGMRATESNQSILIKSVLRGSAAEKAGFASGDEWIAVEVQSAEAAGWRLEKLDDLPKIMGRQRHAVALVARDRRILKLKFSVPEPGSNWLLRPPKLASHT
jgi:predicted metalloprotease with PDZ domain